MTLSAFGDDVAVFPVQGVNMDRSFVDAFGAVLAHRYAKVSGLRVVPPIKSAKVIGPDSNKTIVTVLRMSAEGEEIHRSEMTLLTYGDIEESCDRFARSLYNKIPIEKTRTLSSVTRREGLGHNKVFTEKLTGVKIGGYYPLTTTEGFVTFVTIGYDFRMDSEDFFLEFGAGGRIPSAIDENSKRVYGGMYFELGADYYIRNGVVGVYVGGGVSPFLNFLADVEMGIVPFVQAGVMLPRTSSTRFYADLRVGQTVMPITTGETSQDPFEYSGTSTRTYIKKHIDYPTELGLEFGIAW
jgi:hypothetical protein